MNLFIFNGWWLYQLFVFTLLVMPSKPFAQTSYSPRFDQSYPDQVYFGDTHLHTNLSVDANGMGNISLTPFDAYRFAMGESVIGHNRMIARLDRPLDFLVIADHALNMGVMSAARAGDSNVRKHSVGQLWY